MTLKMNLCQEQLKMDLSTKQFKIRTNLSISLTQSVSYHQASVRLRHLYHIRIPRHPSEQF